MPFDLLRSSFAWVSKRIMLTGRDSLSFIVCGVGPFIYQLFLELTVDRIQKSFLCSCSWKCGCVYKTSWWKINSKLNLNKDSLISIERRTARTFSLNRLLGASSKDWNPSHHGKYYCLSERTKQKAEENYIYSISPLLASSSKGHTSKLNLFMLLFSNYLWRDLNCTPVSPPILFIRQYFNLNSQTTTIHNWPFKLCVCVLAQKPNDLSAKKEKFVCHPPTNKQFLTISLENN